MSEKTPPYKSYMLRMWRVKSQSEWLWRVSLECPETGKITGFPDLESLFSYLKMESKGINNNDEPSDQDSNGRKG
jgi:hypothetical protein